MKSFQEAGQTLSFIHPDPDRRDFVLRTADGEDVAALRFEKQFGSLASAETSTAAWSFKRTGFFKPQITARVSGENEPVATFELGMGGAGAVHLKSGYMFRWASNMWRSEWSWVNASGTHAVSFRRDFSIDKREGRVEIVADAIPAREVPLLVMLGWYIIILLSDDAAVGYAVAH